MKTLLSSGPTRTTKSGHRWAVRLEAKKEDAWVGAFWSSTIGPDHRWAVLDVWVCLLPCIPIHVFVQRPKVPFP